MSAKPFGEYPSYEAYDNAVKEITQHRAEHQRLRDKVVEAAKVECAAYDAPSEWGWTYNHTRARAATRKAVRRLIEFEAKSGEAKGDGS